MAGAACGDDGGEAIEGNDLGGRTVTIAIENNYLPFNYINLDTRGLAVMAVWEGTLKSEPIEFNIK